MRVMVGALGGLALVGCFTDSEANTGDGTDSVATSDGSMATSTATPTGMPTASSSTTSPMTSGSGSEDTSPPDTSTGAGCTIWEQVVTFEVPDLNATFEAFPIAIPIPADSHTYEIVDDPQQDVRIYEGNSDVTVPYEVEVWNPDGESLLWISMPSFGQDGLDQVTLRYGDPDPPSNNPQAVWDEGFTGVWHLSASGDGNAKDSTAHELHGEAQGSAADGFVDGRLGDAFQTEDDADRFEVAGSLLGITGDITVEAWVQASDVTKGGAGADRVPVRRGTDYRLIAVHSDGGAPAFSASLDGVLSTTPAAAALVPGAWSYIVGAYDSDGLSIFLDGEITMAGGETGDIDVTGLWLNIGGQLYRGRIDEVRVSNQRRSNLWIRTQHRMVTEDRIMLGEPVPACD